MNDVLEYRIHIEQFSRLLLWLTLLFFFGMMVVATVMMTVSRFFLTSDGQSFSILRFQLPFSYTTFKTVIDNLSVKTKDTIRMHHQLDNYFMAFAYLFLFFGGWYVLRVSQAHLHDPSVYELLWMPPLIWILDYVENKMALQCLNALTVTNSRLLLIFSVLKWLFLVIYVALVVVAASAG